jgi:hypothetical protein
MTRVKSMIVMLTAATFALSGVAFARSRTVLVPPGDSALSQYVEVVPTDTGVQRSQPSGGGAGILRPEQVQALDGLGPEGRTLAEVVDQTSPPDASLRPVLRRAVATIARGDPPWSASRPADPLAGVGSRSTMSMIADTMTSGLAILVPLTVLAVALGLGVRTVVRRRASR